MRFLFVCYIPYWVKVTSPTTHSSDSSRVRHLASVWCNTHSSDILFLRQFEFPTKSLLRQPTPPTPHISDTPHFRHPTSPTSHFSDKIKLTHFSDKVKVTRFSDKIKVTHYSDKIKMTHYSDIVILFVSPNVNPCLRRRSKKLFVSLTKYRLFHCLDK